MSVYFYASVDIDRRLSVYQDKDEYANASLLRAGFLGCSPREPSVVISIQTLELYHRLKRRHPRLGIQPMVKALCDLHEVSTSFFVVR